MLSAKSVGQYCGVSVDLTRKDAGRKFRIIVYGAYNAMGLIGSECNGIAILEDLPDSGQVICDEILRTDTGYFGPTNAQKTFAVRLANMPVEQFQAFINCHPRSRMDVDLGAGPVQRGAVSVYAQRLDRPDAEPVVLATADVDAKHAADVAVALRHVYVAALGAGRKAYDICRFDPRSLEVGFDIVDVSGAPAALTIECPGEIDDRPYGVKEATYLTPEGYFAVKAVAERLPHGSGIDYGWYIRETTTGTIHASNAYHGMDEGGGYCCVQDFTAILHWDPITRKFGVKRIMLHDDNRHAHNYMLREYLNDTLYDWLNNPRGGD